MISTARIRIGNTPGWELEVEHKPGAVLELSIPRDFAPGTGIELAFAALDRAGLKGVGPLRVSTR